MGSDEARLVTNRANTGSGVEVNVGSDTQSMELWGGRQGSGMLAMAQMPDDEFELRLTMLEKGTSRIQQIKKSLMKEGVHYGKIPGTDKTALLKPGAEVLCNVYGLRPDFVTSIEYGDGVTAPPIRVTLRAEFHLGDMTGPVVGIGLGAASSWEKRYRYRRGERSCPACGVVGSVIKGKAEYGGGWLCWAKKGGCGAKFDDGDPDIASQVVGDVENPDQHDLLNTLIKMGAKRSQIDGALRVTGSSDLFTQDVEEGVIPDSEESDTSGGGTYEPAHQEPAPAPRAAAPVPPRQAPAHRNAGPLLSARLSSSAPMERLDSIPPSARLVSMPSRKMPQILSSKPIKLAGFPP